MRVKKKKDARPSRSMKNHAKCGRKKVKLTSEMRSEKYTLGLRDGSKTFQNAVEKREIRIQNAFAKNPRSAFAIDEKPFEMRLKNHAKTIEKREICIQISFAKIHAWPSPSIKSHRIKV